MNGGEIREIVMDVDGKIDELRKQQGELREKIAELRKSRPAEPVKDYELTRSTGEHVRLSRLFGGRTDLIVIHNMGSKCPMCTLWADGFNGLRKHLENRAGLVVTSPDAPKVQREFAQSRGWKFAMASIRDTSFAADLGMQDTEKDFHYPGISVLRKAEGGSITRVARDFFGPGDDYCPMWSILSLFPEGQNDWWPKFDYDAPAGEGAA